MVWEALKEGKKMTITAGRFVPAIDFERALVATFEKMAKADFGTNVGRAHVRAMMGPNGLGYTKAKQVLAERKARPELFALLEVLREQKRKEEARRAAASFEEAA